MATQPGKMAYFVLSGLPTLILRVKKKYVERTYKVRNILDNVGDVLANKASEDSQNKENMNDSRGFIAL